MDCQYKNLYAVEVTIEGDAATYKRTVLVVAGSESDATHKTLARFKQSTYARIAETMGRYENDIFSVPILKHDR